MQYFRKLKLRLQFINKGLFDVNLLEGKLTFVYNIGVMISFTVYQPKILGTHLHNTKVRVKPTSSTQAQKWSKAFG